MRQMIRRHIGQILLDGRFLSRRKLDRALEEQKQTKELLGQVLVRMGVLRETDVAAPLLLQEHLGHIEDAVRVAAGERQLLGALLVQSGKITARQLDQAIEEQKRTGERLGEVFTRLGMLTERQLNALLDFQHNQSEKSDSPLRLGELLVSTGHISRKQLEAALAKQSTSRKKLGEVLVEEGYARPSQIRHGIRLQKMLMHAALASILSMGISATAVASGVVLQWDPNTEPDLAGYKVYYTADSGTFDGVIPIDVQNQTTATINDLDPTKAYRFAVTAYNASGTESGFSNIVTVEELSPPTVEITSPGDAGSVSGAVSINVSAGDNVGVTKVEFYVNGILKGEDTGTPYLYSWDAASLPTGSYTLTAKAYDAAGNSSESSRSVTVVNDTIPPTADLTAPVDNTLVSGSVIINADALDNVGVSMVEFYANGVLLFGSNAAPYSYTWDTRTVANGSYTLTARATDNKGNAGTSSTVTVNVNNPTATAPATAPLTIADATLAVQASIGKVTLSGEDKARLDVAPFVDGRSQPNARVDTGDAIVILSKIVGKISL